MKTVREKFLTVAEAEKGNWSSLYCESFRKNGRDAEFVN